MEVLEDAFCWGVDGYSRSGDVSLEVSYRRWIENPVGFDELVYGKGPAKRVPGTIEGYLFLNLRGSKEVRSGHVPAGSKVVEFVCMIVHSLPDAQAEVATLRRTSARVHDFGTVAVPDGVSGIEFGAVGCGAVVPCNHKLDVPHADDRVDEIEQIVRHDEVCSLGLCA
jgi:hypothetical protein